MAVSFSASVVGTTILLLAALRRRGRKKAAQPSGRPLLTGSAYASAASPFLPRLYGPFSFHFRRTGTPASPRSSRMRFCKKPS